MSIFRRIGLAISSSMFRFLLFAGATSLSVNLLFGNSQHLKQTLIDQKVYDKFVPAIIDTNLTSNTDTGSIPLQEPAIQTIIQQSFPSNDLKTHAESIIDATYDWLGSAKPELSFNVDLTTNKVALADGLSQYAYQRLTKLPLCFATPAEVDPFTIPCQPPSFNLTKAQAELRGEILNNKSFLPNTRLSADNLPKNLAGQNIAQQYYYAPKVFTLVRLLPWLMTALLLICGALTIFWHQEKRAGFRSISFGIASGGFFLILSPLVFGFLLPGWTKSLQSNSQEQTQAIIKGVIDSLTRDFNSLLINVGIQMLAIGIILMGLERLSRKRVGFSSLAQKTGLQTSHQTMQPKGIYKLRPDALPVQSSEVSHSRPARKKTNPKYRKIPRF